MREGGLDFLGAEETSGEKTLNVIKKVGPGLISAVTEAFDKDGKKIDSTYKYKPEEKSWFLRPVIGPIPGAGVLVLGAGVLTGLGFAVKKLLAR